MQRTGLDHEHIITKDMKRFGLESMELPISKQQCNSMMRETQSEIDRIVAQSFQQRDQERDTRIQELENSLATADKTHAKFLRRLKRNEKVKRVCEKIKAARTNGQPQGVTRVEIPRPPSADPKTCTEWQTIDVPSEIVENLQRRNRQHFGQAQGSPFTIDPLATDLGFSGDTRQADEVLDGSYITSPGASESVNLLIQHLKLTHEIASLTTHPTVSLEEFQGKLMAWREATTTSPSGMHLGHYKALFATHKYSHVPPLGRVIDHDDPQTQEHIRQLHLKAEYDQMQQSLAELHLSLLNYALERGYSFRRWQRVANTILFKDPGSVKIHRTRVIHIYEADFNLMLGIKWRVALYQSEALKQLNDGQYGSRPRRNAIDPVMIEELQFEISRLTRRTFIQTNYDATACYDRIIPNLAMLASRRFGVPKEVTQSNASTLHKAKCHIRTELGLSDTYYSHSPEDPIYGTGQGSGNSPMIWCFLSSLLFDCYDLRAHPAQYCNPDWTNQSQISMIGFVDDCNGQVNSFYEPESPATLQALLEKARTNVLSWSALLQATGGALELTKCSYHVVYWKFSMQGAPVLSNISREIGPLHIVDPHSGDVQTLEYLPPSVAHKTLGHYKEPMGLQKMQFRQLKWKSENITAFLWSNHFTREEAWTFYRSCYVPAVAYPLTCSFLSQSQLKHIQCKAMAIITAKCGFNRNTKTEVLYGPKNLGGADFRHLVIQQGISQTLYFLRHWRLGSTIGKLLKSTMAWTQLSVGMSYPILERTQDSLPHLEAKWIGSLRQFLGSISASIYLDEPGVPQPQRENDMYLMDAIVHSDRFTPTEIRKLNYCRMYLQAVTLSDITKPDGQELDPSKLLGRPSMMSSRTRWHTVHQDRPSDTEWKLWQSANRLWSDETGRLLRALGAWTQPLSKQRFQTFAYIYRRSLFILTADNTYAVHRHVGHDRFRPSSSATSRAYAQLPEQARSAEVSAEEGGYWKLHGIPSQTIRTPVISTSATATFELFVSTLEPWEAELLSDVTLHVDPFTLCLELTPGFRAVSDGSVKLKRHGSFGWVISTLQGERLATGMGPARG